LRGHQLVTIPPVQDQPQNLLVPIFGDPNLPYSAATMRILTRPVSATLLAAAFLAPQTDLRCQANWTLLKPTASPTPRFGHAMTFDIIRNRVVMFGGWDSTSRSLADTWEYDGKTWTKMAPTASPPGRDGHVLAYDLARGRTVLFGGDANGTIKSDTWEYDGKTWLQIKPTTVPTARKSHTLTWDVKRSRVVMFGGNAGSSTYLNDTWDWDGKNWARHSTNTSPTVRIAHCAAYDPVTKGIIVFSGYPNLPNDTWLFDGTDWKLLKPAASPPARYDVTLTTDLYRNRVVLFGANSDLWEWNGSTWLKRAPKTMPPNRRDHDMVYDFIGARMIMFGGSSTLAGTWEYKTSARPSVRNFGAGCAGSVGTPALTAIGLPWFGEVLPLRVTNVVTSGPCIMMIGLSNTDWLNVKLPADLSSAGMPGCYLRVEPRILQLMTVTGGVGTGALPVPPHIPLIGVKFYCQTANIDYKSNKGNTTVSNSLEGLIGAK
jgi:hypothetical protein